MARTNSIITIASRNKSYNGTHGNSTSNNYAAWIQEGINAESVSSVFGGSIENIDRARGLVILFEDVNLTNCYMTYNNSNYEIMKYAKILHLNGTVRQVEFIYG